MRAAGGSVTKTSLRLQTHVGRSEVQEKWQLEGRWQEEAEIHGEADSCWKCLDELNVEGQLSQDLWDQMEREIKSLDKRSALGDRDKTRKHFQVFVLRLLWLSCWPRKSIQSSSHTHRQVYRKTFKFLLLKMTQLMEQKVTPFNLFTYKPKIEKRPQSVWMPRCVIYVNLSFPPFSNVWSN